MDGETINHGGYDAESVDSTGAGDAFPAGFIAARLDGAGYAAALAYGNATGALATTAEGAWVAPARDDVQALLEAEE